MWGEGNEAFWGWLQQNGYGIADFLILLDSRKRDNRFKDAGLMNQPGMIKREVPIPELGLYLDQADGDKVKMTAPKDDVDTEPEEPVADYQERVLREPFEVGDKALYTQVINQLANDGVDPRIYGYPSGVIGLRLFPNPEFFGDSKAAGKARDYWQTQVVNNIDTDSKDNASRYYSGNTVSADPKLVRPFRVAMACSFCHVGPHPLAPPTPEGVEKPAWGNMSSTIGNQYWRPEIAFSNLRSEGSFLWQFVASQQPGTIDTSLISTDHINNPNTINAIFEVNGRLARAALNPPEAQSPANLQQREHVLQNLDSEMRQKPYAEAMKGKSVRVIGLYVGWRGRSLPWLIDYLTFWGRKSAARRVGEGDLQEFMARLQRIYNDHAAARKTTDDPFFGLVSIGHSFGGAVLLAATADYFESQLQLANPKSGFLRTGFVDHTGSAAPATLPITAKDTKPLGGFGDMVVLVNPAVESAAYERINVLSRGVDYPPEQTPLLVTFSAENDRPRQGLFKAGRIAGEFFTNAATVEDDRERASLREALGVYDANHSGITHELTPVVKVPLLMTQRPENPDLQCTNKRPGTYEWREWDEKKLGPNDRLEIEKSQFPEGLESGLKGFDFSGNNHYSGLNLHSAKDAPTARRWQPFLVVKVNEQVIDGHNGIFSGPFMNFLTRYIGLTEAKRIELVTQGNRR